MIYPIFIAAWAGLVTASGYLSSLASLDTSKVAAGEIWRLVTGHLSHLTWRQYAVDAPAFTALYASYGRRVTRAAAIYLSLFAALCVSLAVILAGVHQVYGGLSGLSCAAVSALLLGMILERPRQPFCYLMCALFCCYLLFLGGFAGGVNVAREAHFAGAISGAVFVLLRQRYGSYVIPCPAIPYRSRLGSFPPAK